jgi:hypothetical protein
MLGAAGATMVSSAADQQDLIDRATGPAPGGVSDA